MTGLGKELNEKTNAVNKLKNAKLMFDRDCPKVSKIETKIINVFCEKFKTCEYGREYFIGNCDDMIIEINLIIDKVYDIMRNIKNAKFDNDIKCTLDINVETTEKYYELDKQKLNKLIDMNDISLNAQEELFEFNIIKEHKKLKKNKNNLDDYDKAIYNICDVLINCVENDKENGDYYSEKNNEKLKQSGHLLNTHGGTSTLIDAMNFWIPKRYRSEISLLWNGIGEWRA